MAPYTLYWGNGASDDQKIGATLAAGTYTVTVTDANGCTKTTSVTITDHHIGGPSLPRQARCTCNGAATGSIDLTVTGGTAPYTYTWSNSPTSQDITGLVAGTYTVTVTDANGCTKSISATITEPPALVLSVTTVNVLCFQGSNGSIDLTVTGGRGSLHVHVVEQAASTQDISNLVIGTYTVTVTDANNCTKPLRRRSPNRRRSSLRSAWITWIVSAARMVRST